MAGDIRVINYRGGLYKDGDRCTVCGVVFKDSSAVGVTYNDSGEWWVCGSVWANLNRQTGVEYRRESISAVNRWYGSAVSIDG